MSGIPVPWSFSWSLLDLPQKIHIRLVLGSWKLDTIFYIYLIGTGQGKRIISFELQSNIFHILPRCSSSPLLQVHSCQFMVNLLSTRASKPARNHCFLEIWLQVCTDVGYSFPYKQFPLLNFMSFLSACAFSWLRSLQMASWLWRIKHSSQFFIFFISCIHCPGHWWRGHRQLFVAVPAPGAHMAPSSRLFSLTSWAECPFYNFSTSVCMNLSVMNFSSPLLSEAPASRGNLPGCQWCSEFQTCQQKTTGGSVGCFQFPTVTLFFLRNTWLLNF